MTQKLGFSKSANYLGLNVIDFFETLRNNKVKYSREKEGGISLRTGDLDKFKKGDTLDLILAREDRALSEEIQKDEMESQKQNEYFVKIGINPETLSQKDRLKVECVFKRKRILMKMFYNNDDTSDRVIRSNLSETVYSDDSHFEDYLRSLSKLTSLYKNPLELFEAVRQNAFNFSSVHGTEEMYSKVERQMRPQEKASAAPKSRSMYADCSLIERIESAGFDFEDFETIITKGIRQHFKGNMRLSIQSINHNVQGRIKDLKKLLNHLEKVGIVKLEKRGAYSLTNCVGEVPEPFRSYLSNYYASVLPKK